MSSKQVTIVDIAKHANLTHATVSRALRDNPVISKKTRKRVKEVAQKLGYRPNHAAKSLKLGRTFTISVVIPDFINPYYAEFVKIAKRECEKRNYQVSVTECGMKADHELASLERLLDKRSDGIIAFLTNFDAVKETIHEFWDRKLPFVGMGMPFDDCVVKFDSVSVDAAEGYRKAADHLVDLGHSKISFVAGWLPVGYTSINERYFYSIERMRQRKIKVDEKRIIHHFSGNQVVDGVEIANRIIQQIPDTTAVVCSNELVAMGLLRGFSDAGIRVPEDMSLVSTDNTWLGKNLSVPLTSIDLNSPSQAVNAMKMIWDRIEKWEEPKNIFVPTDFVVRDSTTKVRNYDFLNRQE